MPDAVPARRLPVIEAGAVFALALTVRLAGIGQEAFSDELFHVLAAREYLQSGTLIIGGTDPYARVQGFTVLVAGLFRVFGESLAVGRIPAILCGSLLPAAVFWWVRRASDRPAAWIAALLVCFTQDLVAVSQMVRFYAPQQLAFFLGTVATAGFVEAASARGRLMTAGAAVAALAVAVYCQVATLIGVAALAVFVALAFAEPAWGWVAAARTGRRVLLLAAAGVGVIAAIAVSRSDAGRRLWEVATFTPLWLAHTARDPGFYHRMLLADFPTLWTLAPLLALAALFRRPRLAWCCAVVFAVSFVALSLFPAKGGRYIGFVMPHFLIICAIGAAGALAAFGRSVQQRLEGTAVGVPSVPGAAVGALAAIAVLVNPGIHNSLRELARDRSHSYPGYNGPPLSWRQAAVSVRPLIDSSEVVVSTDALKTLYYLGRVDFALSRNDLVTERGTAPEFSPAPHLGTPVITRPASVEWLVRCHRSGLLVSTGYALETGWRVSAETRAAVEAGMQPVPLPPETGMVAFIWRAAAAPSRDCAHPPAQVLH